MYIYIYIYIYILLHIHPRTSGFPRMEENVAKRVKTKTSPAAGIDKCWAKCWDKCLGRRGMTAGINRWDNFVVKFVDDMLG